MCNSVEASASDREPHSKDNEHFFKCKARCCTFCSYCARAFSKERNKSQGSRLLLQEKQIKVCEKCFLCHSIDFVNPVINAPNIVTNLPVGSRLQNFWKKWLDLGAGPKVVQILKEGYTLPFRIRPNLSRIPTVISCYGNPHRNLKLLEALYQLMDKNAIELVHKQVSLGFFNRLFLVPKPNNKWRPILDLSNLNLFLKTKKFKMETPEVTNSTSSPVASDRHRTGGKAYKTKYWNSFPYRLAR